MVIFLSRQTDFCVAQHCGCSDFQVRDLVNYNRIQVTLFCRQGNFEAYSKYNYIVFETNDTYYKYLQVKRFVRFSLL
jgi:hypothetical protein